MANVKKSAVEAAKELFESMAYEHELDCAVRKVRKILTCVGCTVEKKGPYVRLISSRTGSHTLCMARGVRPVSDLIVYAAGFAEQQPYLHSITGGETGLKPLEWNNSEPA